MQVADIRKLQHQLKVETSARQESEPKLQACSAPINSLLSQQAAREEAARMHYYKELLSSRQEYDEKVAALRADVDRQVQEAIGSRLQAAQQEADELRRLAESAREWNKSQNQRLHEAEAAAKSSKAQARAAIRDAEVQKAQCRRLKRKVADLEAALVEVECEREHEKKKERIPTYAEFWGYPV